MQKPKLAMAKPDLKAANQEDGVDAKSILKGQSSNEIWFGVVGPVGAGGTRAIDGLAKACAEAGYKPEIIKMSSLIRTWAEQTGKELPPEGERSLDIVELFQNLGDEIRKPDSSAIARLCLSEIARRRADATGVEFKEGDPVKPDGEKRAWLIDSIKHPAETQLFRKAYGNAFALVGVVCEEEVRAERIKDKFLNKIQQKDDEHTQKIEDFIKRDADDSLSKHGQHVTDAFHQADFFVDNTANDEGDEFGLLHSPLARLVSIIAHDIVVRPTIEETAMHHAHSARVRSACLSRQVGAALVDTDGTVVSTGTNEVPKAGGGVYGEHFATDIYASDDRCAFRESVFCSSNKQQNEIVDELISRIPELKDADDQAGLRQRILKTRLGGLIEFSRAVHAEMDALLSAGREGKSTVGTRLFVTTFPCHYCARHIVSSGVDEVQYIEPYPKSLALKLHFDSIAVSAESWEAPSGPMSQEAVEGNKERKVLFRPFVGVAPRMYIKAFEKTRGLKNKISGDFEMAEPEWGDEWSPLVSAFPEIEAMLAVKADG